MKDNVKERPILFSTPMVQGILSKVKRMTRRTKGLERINETPESFECMGLTEYEGNLIANFILHRVAGFKIKCPYGKPGDRIWVREAWGKCNEKLVYAASVCSPKYDKPKYGWKPSIHMPRVASRILLEITDIRVERLQYITEEDAIAEGVEHLHGVMGDYYKHYSAHLHYSKEELKDGCPFTANARKSFSTLWESINGRESLLENPWVWVVSFKVLEVKK